MTEHKVLGIIPARYASTRFPGKPLAILNGKPVIQHVWERVSQVLNDAVVATDDERIKQCVESFGGKVVMTRSDHKSGTDRCYEAMLNFGGDHNIIINVQGDEPFVRPDQIEAIIACFDDPGTDIATLVKPFDSQRSIEELQNPNSVKVVVDRNQYALYFSRSVIPFMRGLDNEQWPTRHKFFTHLGMYAYRADVLAQITSLPQSSLEIAESLEQLRWLENGYRIKVGLTHHSTIGIDTPQDLKNAEDFIKSHNNY